MKRQKTIKRYKYYEYRMGENWEDGVWSMQVMGYLLLISYRDFPDLFLSDIFRPDGRNRKNV
jgi:hypothetical protein